MFDCIPNAVPRLLNLCHERYHLLQEKKAALATSPAVLPGFNRQNKLRNVKQKQKPKTKVGFLVIEVYFIFVALSCSCQGKNIFH